MSFIVKQKQQIAQILKDFNIGYYITRNYQTVNIRNNNQKTITLAKNLYLTEKSKYIDILYYLIKNL